MVRRKQQEQQNMQCVQEILDHPLYIKEAKRIEQLEQDRVYCRHGFDHLMDVARIAYIKFLEQQVDADCGPATGGDGSTERNRELIGGDGSTERNREQAKRMIYAAALLHDIGRARELEPQGEASDAAAGTASRSQNDCGTSRSRVEQAAAGTASRSQNYCGTSRSRVDHAEAGAKIAEEILTDLDWSDADKNAIVSAIGAHRGAATNESSIGTAATSEGGEQTDTTGAGGEQTEAKQARTTDFLANLIKEADNLSRRCWDCESRDTCNWDDERKNLSITI